VQSVLFAEQFDDHLSTVDADPHSAKSLGVVGEAEPAILALVALLAVLGFAVLLAVLVFACCSDHRDQPFDCG
jgi:hypothetical protein